MKVIYVMVVLWGERYRRYWTEWCLPSLLAPGNLPTLTGDVKCLIVCPDEDWSAMKNTRAFDVLTRTAQPIHLSFNPDRNLNPCKAMGVGHRLATQIIAEAKGIGIPVTPDLMLSDGMLTTAQRYYQDGATAVLTVALRFAEEVLVGAMHQRGYQVGQVPLVIPAREMAAMGMESLHPETRAYEWGSPEFSKFPAACWVRADDGMVCASLSWAPVWLDYRRLAAHTTQTFDHWTMDGDYIYRNWGDGPHVRMIRDTDEGVLLSWTPSEPRSDFPLPQETPVRDGAYVKAFGKWFNSRVFDPLKRQRFWEPVLWHPSELTATYLAKEQALLDDFGRLLNYDWRRGGYVNEAGQIVATLAETPDQYEVRARQRT